MILNWVSISKSLPWGECGKSAPGVFSKSDQTEEKGEGNVTKYVVKRILLAVITVFIICAITFFLMHAIPGGPFNREKALSEATIAALNARYNLDKPVPQQFLLYMKNMLHGDFGK